MLIRLNTLGRGSLIRDFFLASPSGCENIDELKNEILLKFALLASDVNDTKAQRRFS